MFQSSLLRTGLFV